MIIYASKPITLSQPTRQKFYMHFKTVAFIFLPLAFNATSYINSPYKNQSTKLTFPLTKEFPSILPTLVLVTLQLISVMNLSPKLYHML